MHAFLSGAAGAEGSVRVQLSRANSDMGGRSMARELRMPNPFARQRSGRAHLGFKRRGRG
jgi:hypothetical protein